MKRTVQELKETAYDERLGVEVIDSSLLLGLEWGELASARRALEKVEENVLLDKKEEEAIRTVVALISKLE